MEKIKVLKNSQFFLTSQEIGTAKEKCAVDFLMVISFLELQQGGIQSYLSLEEIEKMKAVGKLIKSKLNQKEDTTL